MKGKYIIVASETKGSLIRAVSQYIAEGWKPQGGASSTKYVVDGELRSEYIQTMVKEDND